MTTPETSAPDAGADTPDSTATRFGDEPAPPKPSTTSRARRRGPRNPEVDRDSERWFVDAFGDE